MPVKTRTEWEIDAEIDAAEEHCYWAALAHPEQGWSRHRPAIRH